MPDSYELEPEPIRPDLPGEVSLGEGPEEVITAAAADLYLQANACVRQFGDFHLALTGGQMVEKLFIRLMADPLYRALPWTRTQLWVAADRSGDRDCGAGAIVDQVLRHHAGIPCNQIHTLDPGGPDAHATYEKKLLETLGWREKGHDRLDFLVASLSDEIPGSGVDLAGGRVVSRYRTVDGDECVSMTPWFVSGARFIAMLASGDACQPAIRAACGGEFSFQPVGGVQKWYLDHAAVKEDV
jgi:6-phosphogluconolactonase